MFPQKKKRPPDGSRRNGSREKSNFLGIKKGLRLELRLQFSSKYIYKRDGGKKESYLMVRKYETGNLFPWTPERYEMGINYAGIERVRDKVFLYRKRGKFPAGGLPCLRFPR